MSSLVQAGTRSSTEITHYFDDLAALIPDRSIPLILIKENVCRILEQKLTEDGFNVLNGGSVIYFPATGRQKDFYRQFGAILESAGI
jgi:hypothetical protein